MIATLRTTSLMTVFGIAAFLCHGGPPSTGGMNIGDTCDPELEYYYVYQPEDFRGHRYLCNAVQNLECKLFPQGKSWELLLEERMEELEVQNVSRPAELVMQQIYEETSERDDNMFWSCDCEDNTTQFEEFNKASYWDTFLQEALDIGFDMVDVLDQASNFLPKCAKNLGDECSDDRFCPPNSVCLRESSNDTWDDSISQSNCTCVGSFVPVGNVCLENRTTTSCASCKQYNFIVNCLTFPILSIMCYFLLVALVGDDQHDLIGILEEFNPFTHIVITSGVY